MAARPAVRLEGLVHGRDALHALHALERLARDNVDAHLVGVDAIDSAQRRVQVIAIRRHALSFQGVGQTPGFECSGLLRSRLRARGRRRLAAPAEGDERARAKEEREARGPRSGAAVGGQRPAAGLAGLMDPRRVIRASYRRFLRSAASAGRARATAETPAGYADRIEEFLGADASHARALTAAYEEARYSDHALGAPLATRARDAVGRLVRRLGGLSARLFGGE